MSKKEKHVNYIDEHVNPDVMKIIDKLDFYEIDKIIEKITSISEHKKEQLTKTRLKNNKLLKNLLKNTDENSINSMSITVQKSKFDYLIRNNTDFMFYIDDDKQKSFSVRYFYDGDNEGFGKTELYIGFYDREKYNDSDNSCDSDCDIEIELLNDDPHDDNNLFDELTTSHIVEIKKIANYFKININQLLQIIEIIFSEIHDNYNTSCYLPLYDIREFIKTCTI